MKLFRWKRTFYHNSDFSFSAKNIEHFPFFSFIKKSFIFIGENQLPFKAGFFLFACKRQLFLNIAILRGTK